MILTFSALTTVQTISVTSRYDSHLRTEWSQHLSKVNTKEAKGAAAEACLHITPFAITAPLLFP